MYCLYKISFVVLNQININTVHKKNNFFINNLIFNKFYYKLNYIVNNNKNIFKVKKSSNTFYRIYYLNKIKLNIIINLINLVLSNNKNILFLDSDYNKFLPIYNKMYNMKDIYLYKNFFFIKKSSVSLNNFLYFYGSFLKNFNISCLFIFDFSLYNNFFLFFTKLNKPLIGLVKNNFNNSYLDFGLVVNKNNINFIKYYMLNLIYLSYYNSYNINCFNNKIKFYSILINFKNTNIR